MRKLGLAYHDLFLAHDAGPDHPERADRVHVIMEAIQNASWHSSVEITEAREASLDELQLVHEARYIRAMKRLCDAGGAYLVAMEATVCEDSYHSALRCAGAGLTLADGIMDGKWDIGFAPTRPPGHHATYDRPCGFSIFNTIAITARYLLTKHKLKRIAIFDFDVHHGNGTESAFWEDNQVFYCSIHRENLYPYRRGLVLDRGEGLGAGYTLNIPLRPGSGDDAYIDAIDKNVIPAFESYKPEFILVSAGFDAHHRDYVGGMGLTAHGYRAIGERVRRMAASTANGRIISVLEGGYDLAGLEEGISNYLGALVE